MTLERPTFKDGFYKRIATLLKHFILRYGAAKRIIICELFIL